MPSEFAPAPGKVRVTKAQLRKKQQQYQKAAAMMEDHTTAEAQEKESEIEKLEEKLDDVF